MPANQQQLERARKLLQQVENLMLAGHDLDSACDQIGIDKKYMAEWANRLSLPENHAEVLSSCHLAEAVVPIFADDERSSVQQIGSGVVLDLCDNLFVLTAAHVIDYLNDSGSLYMPFSSGIERMVGWHSSNPGPLDAVGDPLESDHREADKVDMGYFRLEPEWRSKLHSTCSPVLVDDLLIEDDLEDAGIFTFFGYPWRKGNKQGNVFESELITYTGHALASDAYVDLELNRKAHVAIRFNRRKSNSTLFGPRHHAPLPHGTSGGAVVAWPRSFIDRSDPANMKLAAIAHTYDEKNNCMVGTRVIPYLMAIAKNNPSFGLEFD